MTVGDRLSGYVMGQLIRAANSWRGLVRFEDPEFADDLHNARNRAAQSGLNITREGTYMATATFTGVALFATLLKLHPLAPFAIVLASVPQMHIDSRPCQHISAPCW